MNDALTTKNTAFATYAALLAACRAGYTPTLARKGETAILGHQLQADGCRVFWRG